MTSEPINIPSTSSTPMANLNAETGVLELRGRSIPEEPKNFYAPLIEWVEKYVLSPAEVTTVNIALDYFNSSSRKWLLNFLRRLEPIIVTGKKVTVNWYYEEDDEDLQTAGEDFKQIINLPFKLIEVTP